MDGRFVRKMWFAGFLFAGSLGCNRNEIQSPWDGMAAGSPIPGLPQAKRQFWGGGGSQSALPIEVTPESSKKGPPQPDTYVAFADAQAEVAFDEKTPQANREWLLDRARQGYQKALQIDPNNKPATLGLARYYTRLGERDKSVEMFKRYLTANPGDRDVAHEVAMAHAQWKDWDGAVGWCDFALKIDPENLSVRKTKAFCLARGGKWEKAFDVMLQVMPEPQARYNIARVMEHLNMSAASKQQLQLAIRADPNFTDAREFLTALERVPDPNGNPDANGLQQAGFNQPQQP